jgi:hypothetical protein
MRNTLWAVATAIASVTAGIIGGLLVMPVGLILHDVLSWLLVLAVAGVFASLGASWAGTLLGPGADGVQLMPVLVGTEVVALGLWIVRLSSAGAALARALETNLAYVLACAVVLAASTVTMASQTRGAERDLGRLLRRTLSLVGGLLMAVPTVVYLASLFGLVGA